MYTQTVYVSGGNYYANPLVRVYVVRRADVKISIDNENDHFVYDGAPVDLTATVTDANGNKVDGAKVIYSYANCNGIEFNGLPTDVGTYLVTAAYFGDSQYACAVDVGVITIHAQDLTVTLKDAVKLHGAEDPQFAYDVTGLQGGDTAQVNVQREAGDEPGAYALTATVTVSKANNYKVTVNGATLLIVDVEQPELPADGDVELGNTTEYILGNELCGAMNEILQGKTPTGMDAETVEALKAAMKNDETITIELVASELTPEQCPEEDKTLVEGALQDGQSVAQYLSFEIEIKANDTEIGHLTDLRKPLTITVEVPEAYQAAANRNFDVIRVHGGEAAALGATQNGNEVQFTSDEFSTYALVYADVKQEGGQGNQGGSSSGSSQNTNTSTSTVTPTATATPAPQSEAAPEATPAPAEQASAIPQTGDNSQPMLWAMLMGLSALGLAAVVVLRKRKKHSEE